MNMRLRNWHNGEVYLVIPQICQQYITLVITLQVVLVEGEIGLFFGKPDQSRHDSESNSQP